ISAYYSSPRSPFAEAVTARRQANFVTGQVVAWAVLRATLSAIAATEKQILWAQRQFELSLTQALWPAVGGVVSSSSDLVQRIQDYRIEIGEVDQTLADTDEQLDDWLRPENIRHNSTHELSGDENNTPDAAKADTEKDATARNTVRTFLETKETSRQKKEIEQWLVRWLAQRLKVPAGQVETDRALADYGVDSVMAVELAQDVEEFLALAKPLDVTLAWNFPTLSALGAHLALLSATSVAVQDVPRSTQHLNGTETSSAEVEEDAFEELADEDIAAELAAELAALRGRRT
ncbi:MAG: acyl carrier protein, partial [Cyanobacteria bacterium J06632_22]